MIRIETIAEFDAEGRFTVTGQATEAVAPGPHRVTLEVADQSAPTSIVGATNEPALKRINNVLVLTGQMTEDPEKVRQRLDEERLLELSGSALFPTIVEEDGLLLLNALPEGDASVDIQSLIDADRDDRMKHIVGPLP
jgi:hypothetical protein